MYFVARVRDGAFFEERAAGLALEFALWQLCDTSKPGTSGTFPGVPENETRISIPVSGVEESPNADGLIATLKSAVQRLVHDAID